MPALLSSQSRQAGTTPKSSSSKDHRPAKKQKISQPSKSQSVGLGALIPQKEGPARKNAIATLNGAKDSTRLHKFDESEAVIQTGVEEDVDMEDASVSGDAPSDEENEDMEDLEDDNLSEGKDGDMFNGSGKAHHEEGANGINAQDDSRSAEEEDEEGEADDRPTFGDLLESRAIDVEDSLAAQGQTSRALSTTNGARSLAPPSASSLGTVLTQALRTNDRDLLETCFQMNDLDSIRDTIQRLDSSLVASLLQRLAQRLHKKPGRASNLMVWVQWSLISHGGYLASQRDVVKQLQDLNRVLKERASGLQPLLSLKGKLDILSAQLQLRRNMQRTANDEDEAVIYVEGQESDSEVQRPTKSKLQGRDMAQETLSDDSGDDGMDMPALGEEVENEDDDDDDSEDLIDDEAEETDADSGDELSEVESDEDDDEEEMSEIEEPRPIKRSKAAAARSSFTNAR